MYEQEAKQFPDVLDEFFYIFNQLVRKVTTI